MPTGPSPGRRYCERALRPDKDAAPADLVGAVRREHIGDRRPLALIDIVAIGALDFLDLVPRLQPLDLESKDAEVFLNFDEFGAMCPSRRVPARTQRRGRQGQTDQKGDGLARGDHGSATGFIGATPPAAGLGFGIGLPVTGLG